MPNYPDYVEERLAHGSLCHVCPLNGQRKVGHDGPASAEHIAIAEAPGADEESWHRTQGEKYGRPLVGKSGYFFKLNHLAPAGLVELLPGRNPAYPRIGRLKVHLMDVAMCRPPDNKIDSAVGKKAVRCCANSARWFLNERLRENPDRSLHPMGGTALSLLRGEKTPIEPYRGRPTGLHAELQFPYEPEASIYKYVLRGVKPPKESIWWTVEPVLRLVLRTQRTYVLRASKRVIPEVEPVLRGVKPKEEWWPVIERVLKIVVSKQRSGVLRASKRIAPEYAHVLAVVKILLGKQRAALKKKAASTRASLTP